MRQNIGVVIPSYNETANIALLIRKIFICLPEACIIIVDDSKSQENKKLKKVIKHLHTNRRKKIVLISRQSKLGRGSAVLLGFKEILRNERIQYVFEMDADLAHDPEDFKKFFHAMTTSNADLIIGSRYLSGSKIVNWPASRLILSKIINTGINLWLRLHLSDYTNGFRLYRRDAVNYLTTIQLREKGFIALSETAYKLKKNNYKIFEVPITFKDRKYGKSSADLSEFISSLIGIIRILIYP